MISKKILAFSILLFLFNLEAKCVPIFYATDAEELHIIKHNIDGYHDYGVFYKQFHIFWIPIWNYDKKPVLIKNDRYWNLTYNDEIVLRKEYYIDTSDLSIPFWDAFGGKIVLILLIIGIIIFKSD